jgi:hypothetical protein
LIADGSVDGKAFMRKQASIGDLLNLKAIVALSIVLTEIVFINELAAGSFELILSSALVTIALLIQLRFAVRADSPGPADIVIFIFNWLFLDLAPKVQLINQPQQLVNTSTVAIDRVALTNLVCALFMVAFTLFYEYLTRRAIKKSHRPAEPARTPVDETPVVNVPAPAFSGVGIGIAVFFCIAVVGIAAPFAYRSVENQATLSPALLVMNRFLLFLPSATMLIVLNETVRSGRKVAFSRVCVLLLLFVLVAITENPYTEKRNALGPVYMGMLLVGFQNWFSTTSRRLALLIFAMVLIFPASSIFTHNHQQTLGAVSFTQFSDAIAEHYFSVNYDSWANVYTSIEYVQAHGVQWGHQLLGSVLFFVPSAIWTTKPLATGIFLANYLISNYAMWFTNLSAPFVAEGYLDFGYFGVIAYGGVTAFVVTLLNRLGARRDKWSAFPMAVYASIFLMLVMRGSLMVAMGFITAAFLSFMFSATLLSIRSERRRYPAPRQFSHPTLVS